VLKGGKGSAYHPEVYQLSIVNVLGPDEKEQNESSEGDVEGERYEQNVKKCD